MKSCVHQRDHVGLSPKTLALYLAFTAALLCLSAHADHEPSDASERQSLAECQNLLTLSGTQIEFIEKIVPRSLRKKFTSAQLMKEMYACGSNCLELVDRGSNRRLRVIWDTHVTIPTIEEDASSRLLRLPSHFRWAKITARERDGLIKSWLVGSRFHPQTTDLLNEKNHRRILRSIQRDGVEAVTLSLKSGERSFLYVSPTGTGKTEVLLGAIREAMRIKSQRLIVVLADANILVDQLSSNITSLKSRDEFDQLKWGDGASGRIDELVSQAHERLAKNDKPLILVSTIQSFKAAVKRSADPRIIENLAKELRVVAYDEAHHTGAPQSQAILHSLFHAPEARFFLYGTTATPVHSEVSLLNLFGNNLFWSYIDTGRSFAKGERHPAKLSFIVDQLAHASRLGDLTPFGRFHFIDPEKIDGDQFFIPSEEAGGENARYVVNPKFHQALIESLKPLFERHRSGFLSVGTIAEARTLTAAFNQAFEASGSNKKFAVLHSELTREESQNVREQIKSGVINFAVTVRQLDEGADFPDMSLYIDLNRSVTPRQFLQRAGRVQRLSPGKESVEVVSALAFNELYIQETLELFQSILNNREFVKNIEEKKEGEQPTGTEDPKQRENKKPKQGEIVESKLQNKTEEPLDTLLVGERSGLERIEARLQSFWNRGVKMSVAAVAEELNQFIEAKRRFPQTSQNWEMGLLRKINYCFYNAREEFFDDLSPGAKGHIVAWLIRRLPVLRAQTSANLKPLEEIAAYVNGYFEDYEWLDSLNLGLQWNHQRLADPKEAGPNIKLAAKANAFRFGQDFLDLLDTRAREFVIQVYEEAVRKLANSSDSHKRLQDLAKSIDANKKLPYSQSPEMMELKDLIYGDENDRQIVLSLHHSLQPENRWLLKQWIENEVSQHPWLSLELTELEKAALAYSYWKAWLVSVEGRQWGPLPKGEFPQDLVQALNSQAKNTNLKNFLALRDKALYLLINP